MGIRSVNIGQISLYRSSRLKWIGDTHPSFPRWCLVPLLPVAFPPLQQKASFKRAVEEETAALGPLGRRGVVDVKVGTTGGCATSWVVPRVFYIYIYMYICSTSVHCCLFKLVLHIHAFTRCMSCSIHWSKNRWCDSVCIWVSVWGLIQWSQNASCFQLDIFCI